ncbi:hypothetical protein ACFFX0_13470 [Citricoccus parietis]|uniref:Uncharacterized protein n=1 Tax=Citricoccus parietis TaxID=592307 RepID=A0ABV5FZN8_9MICC
MPSAASVPSAALPVPSPLGKFPPPGRDVMPAEMPAMSFSASATARTGQAMAVSLMMLLSFCALGVSAAGAEGDSVPSGV